ncbi:ferritin-like domain-containing protein [Microbispora triticiradicis]|uniref:ferritin-like domain-containing protein n=1 Tax=Microbispora triticiradicis TaxID=2200763 RepID=UPI0027DDA276|nr:ferritin-like domain-containing protein [Microbispora triticiradicis]
MAEPATPPVVSPAVSSAASPPVSPAAAPSAGALGRALSAEYAAVYAYGVVGGRTKGGLRARATAAFDAHRARRDQLRTLITQRGGTPTEPGPSYGLPFEVRTPSDAVRLAVLVEQRVVTAYLELAADRDPALRRLAALAAQESATRAYGWQPEIGAFPGMPGRDAGPTQAGPPGGEPTGTAQTGAAQTGTGQPDAEVPGATPSGS